MNMFMNMMVNFRGTAAFPPRSFGVRIPEVGAVALALAAAEVLDR